MIRHRNTALILGAVLAAAGAAQAEVVPHAPVILRPYPMATPPPGLLDAAPVARAIGPSISPAPLGSSYAGTKAARVPGVAQTSVDHRFAAGGLVGSAGFLCGMQPGVDDSGAAAATGYDPQGRFLGAKLSFAFK